MTTPGSHVSDRHMPYSAKPERVRALITGASRGIGAAIAQNLALAGYPVIINFRSNSRAAEHIKSLIEHAGGHAELASFDVGSPEECREALQKLQSSNAPPIGILVNNAGIARDNVFPQLSWEDWTSVVRTSLDGFFNVTQPLVMPMVRMRWGRIINIVSVSGVIGNRGQVNYSAAKAGLIGATKALARELAKRHVTVNAVAPGLIDTDMLDNAPVEEIIKQVPMRRLGTPEEVAGMVQYLVSEQASYVTGQVLGINGGLA
jgi:3-oxoacyl-[acyl-carrier protein] reductase